MPLKPHGLGLGPGVGKGQPEERAGRGSGLVLCVITCYGSHKALASPPGPDRGIHVWPMLLWCCPQLPGTLLSGGDVTKD